MRMIVIILFGLLIFMQYRLWVGKGSLAEVNHLKHEIQQLREELLELEARNRELRAEVDDLSSGYEAIEERARKELGMIKQGEVFYHVVDPKALPDD